MKLIDFNKDVSILIKTFNRPIHLKRLLSSIYKYLPEIQTVVVDDGNLQHSICDFKKVELHTIPFNQGIAYGRNLLAQLAKTKYVISLDDDFVIIDNSNFYKLFELISKTNYDIIGGTVIDKMKGERHFEGNITFDGNKLHISSIQPGKEIEKCDIIHNFFIAKTAALLAVKWDNNLKNYEHLDFFIQAKDKINIGYFKDAFVLHDRTPINEEYMKYRNHTNPYELYFANKYNVSEIHLFDTVITLNTTEKWR